MAEGMELTINNLRDELSALKSRISQCRKKGMDTKIAETMIMPIHTKIGVVEVTRDFKDIHRIMDIINSTKNELTQLEEENLNNEMLGLIDKAKCMLIENNPNEAKDIYIKCAGLYAALPERYKKEIFQKLEDVRLKITIK